MQRDHQYKEEVYAERLQYKEKVYAKRLPIQGGSLCKETTNTRTKSVQLWQTLGDCQCRGRWSDQRDHHNRQMANIEKCSIQGGDGYRQMVKIERRLVQGIQ